MGVSVSRNSACPCGSGRKYKRCCLADGERSAEASRFDDAVGLRIQDWSSEALGEEISAALEEFVGSDRTMNDDQLQIFATWFHNDRELSGGDTPAKRYAARADLPEDERAAASRIAGARLGFHRVIAVEPGSWLVLEDMVRGTHARVRSQNVSREAVRWDILLGRVIDGDPPTLWGPTRFFEPCDEPELLAELERLARASGERLGEALDLSLALRSHALELMRFTPPGWSVEPTFFTLEGDPVAFCSATWQVRDPVAAGDRLRALGLPPHEPLEVDLTELSDREVVPVEQRLDERRSAPERPAALPPGLTPADERRLVSGFMTDRMRRWLDEPHPQLHGSTPRAAVAGEDRAEVTRLVRGIENGAERASRRGEPFVEVAWIGEELGLEDELAA